MRRRDWGHQLYPIMQALGRAIVKNLERFAPPKNAAFKRENPDFAICTIKEMVEHSGIELQSLEKKDPFCHEPSFTSRPNLAASCSFWCIAGAWIKKRAISL